MNNTIYNEEKLKSLYDLLDKYDSPDTPENEKKTIYKELTKLKKKSYSDNTQISKGDKNILPNTNDPNFLQKILSKGEFAINKSTTKEGITEELNEFILLQYQIFVKKLISPDTPYKSLLLFYSTGSGKSCASAQIAENFKNYFSKKALIVAPPSIQENYMKELFNIEKYNKNTDSIKQCLGNEYLHQIINRKYLNKEKIDESVKKLVKEKYEFMGYTELGNKVLKLISEYGSDKSENFIKAIDNIYSNRVIIIDEIHNMKLSQEKSLKVSAKILHEYILKYSKNTILILLSATPMYDDPHEIIWLMNTLLLNDKQQLINEKFHIFDNQNNINPKFLSVLQNWTNKYVSYMKGNNSIHFPDQIYPSINDDENILKEKDKYKKDINGLTIENNKNIENLELFKVYMSESQKNIYNIVKKPEKITDELDIENDDLDIENDDLDIENDAEESIVNTKNIVFKLAEISNIVYNSNLESESDSSGIRNINDLYGRTGFYKIFEKSNSEEHSIYKIKYITNNSNKYILNKKNLAEYSPKINKIIEYINKSEGIVFVYSQYIYSGILPIAIALEHQGYSKYSNTGTNVDILKKHKSMNIISNNKKYMIISGDTPKISTYYEKELEILKSNKNADGDLIKIVLVTKKGIEGIDYKNIREIHIMDPWYNLSRIYQIVGRGIRYNSHITLEESKRNTTIYQYVNLLKNSKNETIDYRMYRISENKQKKISKIERVLKESSIDCNLNKDILIQPLSNKDIITSQDKKRNIEIGDKNYSKECDYQLCELNCNPKIEIIKSDIKNKKLIKYETDYTKKIIIHYFNKINKLYNKIFFDLENIKEFYKKNINENYEILYNALYELEANSEIFKLNNMEGYLIYRSKYYIFQPYNKINYFIKDTKISISDRSDPKIKIPKKIVLKKYSKVYNNEDTTNDYIQNINKLKNDYTKIIQKLINNIDHTQIYNLLIDKLSNNDRKLLLQNVAIKKLNDINLINALKSNKLFIFDNKEGEKNNLIAYYDIYETEIKYKCFNNEEGIFKTCNLFTNSEYIKKFKENMSVFLKNKEINKKGFVEIKTKNQNYKIDVKIINVLQKNITAPGTSCGTGYNDKNNLKKYIIKFINENNNTLQESISIKKINSQINLIRLKKDELCIIYEYLLRTYNNLKLYFLTTDIQIYLDIINKKN
jgi:hypothetical protein